MEPMAATSVPRISATYCFLKSLKPLSRVS